jgi:hypothetical protein
MTFTMEDVFVSNCYGMRIEVVPALMKGVWLNDCSMNLTNLSGKEITFTDITITNKRTFEVSTTNAGSNSIIQNPADHLTSVQNNHDGTVITETYLADFELLDWEGNPVQWATVEHYISIDGGAYALEDTYTTDVDGKTGEQDYTWATWTDTSETKADYQHKLVIKIANRPLMVLKNIRPMTNINVQYQPGEFDHGYRCRYSFVGD